MLKVDLFHNILWSNYKGVVFSRLSEMNDSEISFRFFQIAETDFQRVSLSSVDLRYHNYSFELMFHGSYNEVPSHHLMSKLFMTVWKSDADLILLPGYDRPEYWGMLLAAVFRGKKRAVFCDSTIFDRPQGLIKGFLKKLFFSFCNGFFAYGVRAQSYLTHYGASREKIHPRCQAAAMLPGYTTENALKQRIDLAPDRSVQRFLYVGRLSPEKSLDVLLKAFAIVLQSQPSATLMLIGSGPQKKELVGLAHSLGVDGAVEFAGSMEPAALPVQYAKASCLVLPSLSEPWGLVVNEAMSYGCPVIVSNRCGCVPELVENKPTGFVFEAGNVSELAAKLLVVPATFVDVEATARHCMTVISEYKPEAAANAILLGCKKIVKHG